jgi:hypothetical protein
MSTIAKVFLSVALTTEFLINVGSPAFAEATRILQSDLPQEVSAAFNNAFAVNGDIMTAKKGACVAQEQYTKLTGWFRDSIPLTEADKLNGISASDIYEFRVRFVRDPQMNMPDWKPIDQGIAQRDGAPFAVIYKHRASGNQLQSAIFCL